MIRFIVLIFILGPITLTAQEYSEEQLMLGSRSWYLTNIEMEGEDHPFIPNSLVGSSVLSIDLEGVAHSAMGGELFFYYCSGDQADISFVAPTSFEITDGWLSLAYDDCMGFYDNPDHSAAMNYWFLYRDYWAEGYVGSGPLGAFDFEIIENEGGHFSLILTNPEGNKAYYGDEPLSVSAIEKEKISLYPNPAQDHFYIDGLTGEGQIMIYDLTGKQLLHNKWSQPEEMIDISSLESGMYIYRLSVSGEKNHKTGKLIVR